MSDADGIDDDELREAKEAEIKRLRELEDLRLVMSTVHGRRLIWRILCECGMYQEPAVFGATDMTYYNLGGQAKGRWLLAEISVAAGEFYEAMKKENA